MVVDLFGFVVADLFGNSPCSAVGFSSDSVFLCGRRSFRVSWPQIFSEFVAVDPFSICPCAVVGLSSLPVWSLSFQFPVCSLIFSELVVVNLFCVRGR